MDYEKIEIKRLGDWKMGYGLWDMDYEKIEIKRLGDWEMGYGLGIRGMK